jgi:hypothetical protein
MEERECRGGSGEGAGGGGGEVGDDEVGGGAGTRRLELFHSTCGVGKLMRCGFV